VRRLTRGLALCLQRNYFANSRIDNAEVWYPQGVSYLPGLGIGNTPAGFQSMAEWVNRTFPVVRGLR
jgi:hypothetical protein